MCLRVRPACQGPARRARKQRVEVRLRVLGANAHDTGSPQTADLPVELVGHFPEMPAHELLDVSLVARLRPAALVVPPRLLLRPVDELAEPSALQTEQPALLPANDGNECAVTAA